MMGKRTFLSDIEVGMILGEDVIDAKTGNILVAEGTRLNEQILERLVNYGISIVSIDDSLDEYSVLKNEVLTENYKSIEDSFVNIYNDLTYGKSVSIGENDDDIKEFSRQITMENDILSQLQLLKNNDDYTYNHGMGVGVLAAKLGAWLGYTEEEKFILSVAGVYHDLGKLKISKDIVNKKGPLMGEEFEEMKKHPTFSFDLLKQHSNYNDDILTAVLTHHERLDGSGYPFGLKGDDISKYARIIAICDVYHAIISDRVYRSKDSPFTAAEILREESFDKLDPYIVGVFLENISRFYVGNKVLLSDGRVGLIVYIDPVDKTYPIVRIGDDFIDFKTEKNIKIVEITI